MPPIRFNAVIAADLDVKADPSLNSFNSKLKEIVDGLNTLMGAGGVPSKFFGNIDMGGNRIMNVGSLQTPASGDALSKSAADPLYSTAVQQEAMEAVGAKMLQTTRRLNDGTQQHQVSSDLNKQGSIPPSNVSGSLTYTSVAGTSVTWTWTGIIIQLADLSLVAVKNGTLLITLLANTTYAMYPYYDTATGLLTFVADLVNAIGNPPVAFPSAGNTLAAQAQTKDTRISLTNGKTLVTVNGGGGSAALRVRT
jgi:hypothetical protein